MNIDEYWHDIDLRLDKLVEDGCVKLPPLNQFNLNLLANDISAEMKSLNIQGNVHQS